MKKNNKDFYESPKIFAQEEISLSGLLCASVEGSNEDLSEETFIF